MVIALNIGLNLSTAILINALVLGCAVALTRQVRTPAGRACKVILCAINFGTLVAVLLSLPHEQIF